MDFNTCCQIRSYSFATFLTFSQESHNSANSCLTSLLLGSVMKLEEQKADLERQLKTLTKQIKVRCGYSRDGELQHFTGTTLLGLKTLKNTQIILPSLFFHSAFPWHGPRLVLAGSKIKAASFMMENS